MAGNTFGQVFKVTTFGESHGEMIGVVIDGCPAGLKLDLDFIQKQLDRRRPGQSKITTQRKESDITHFVSGLYKGITTGTPLTALIKNEDAREKDYDHLSEKFRPSHADFTYDQKYGHRDHRGGGRSSARETAARVVAGGVAQQILLEKKISIRAYVSQVGPLKLTGDYSKLDFSLIDKNIVRCPDAKLAQEMITLIEKTKKEGDTLGGIIQCIAQNVPAGLGEPVFDKLHADLAKAVMSINAVKGFDYGSGFDCVNMKGSEHNDLFVAKNKKIQTITNHSGGIQGGISNGMDIYFRAAFKPVATLLKKQPTVDKKGAATEIEGRGRHDPCVVPRAVPIVEAMTALTLIDHLMRFKACQ